MTEHHRRSYKSHTGSQHLQELSSAAVCTCVKQAALKTIKTGQSKMKKILEMKTFTSITGIKHGDKLFCRSAS